VQSAIFILPPVISNWRHCVFGCSSGHVCVW